MHDAAPEARDGALRLQLAEGIDALSLSAPADLLERLLRFLHLLQKWNRAYNLTAVREPAEMVRRHLLDSLSIAEDISGSRVLDVGTGAGLPGIPLALLQPARRFTLLDSNGKKTRFLLQARAELELDNIEVVTARIERFRPEQSFDCIVSRAFASLDAIYRDCAPLLAPGGRLLAMKGAPAEAELATLQRPGVQIELKPLRVPGLDEQRTLVTLQARTAAAVDCGE